MFLPIKDYNPVSRPAIIVPALIAINVFMFLFVQPTIGSRPAEQQLFMYCQATIPFEITHKENLSEVAEKGEVRGQGVEVIQRRCPDKNIWLSILTSMFLHGGFLHIAGNMLFLWVFGNNVEDRLGRIKFVIFYLLCGVVATLAQTYVSRDSIIPMVGASGAIAGVLGAYLIMFPSAPVKNLVILFFVFAVDLPAYVVLGIWFLLQVFQGVGDVAPDSGVAYMAHIGGFVAGMVLLIVFRGRRAPPRRPVPTSYDPF